MLSVTFALDSVKAVPGRSTTVLASWPAAQPADLRPAVAVVELDGFADYKTAVTEVVPDAVAVMGPFHVVAWTRAKLDLARVWPGTGGYEVVPTRAAVSCDRPSGYSR